MKFVSTIAMSLFCLAFKSHVQAQRAVDCPGKTLEHAECAYEAYQRADAELNKVWKRINRSFDPAFPEEVKMKKGLLRSQRAWVIWRDAECEGSVGAIMGNGTGRPGSEAICKEQMTVERTKTLLDRYGSP